MGHKIHLVATADSLKCVEQLIVATNQRWLTREGEKTEQEATHRSKLTLSEAKQSIAGVSARRSRPRTPYTWGATRRRSPATRWVEWVP